MAISLYRLILNYEQKLGPEQVVVAMAQSPKAGPLRFQEGLRGIERMKMKISRDINGTWRTSIGLEGLGDVDSKALVPFKRLHGEDWTQRFLRARSERLEREAHATMEGMNLKETLDLVQVGARRRALGGEKSTNIFEALLTYNIYI